MVCPYRHIMCFDLRSPTLPYPSFLYPLYPQSPRLLSPPPQDSIHERKWVILAFMSTLFHLAGCSPTHPPSRKWPKFVLYGWAKLCGIWCVPRLSIHPLTGIKVEVMLGCFTVLWWTWVCLHHIISCLIVLGSYTGVAWLNYTIILFFIFEEPPYWFLWLAGLICISTSTREGLLFLYPHQQALVVVSWKWLFWLRWGGTPFGTEVSIGE